jgi:hypothetical protein
MVRHIYGIGSGRYSFDKFTFNSFIAESRNRPLTRGQGAAPEAGEGAAEPGDLDAERIFEEVMSLYHDYARCQSVELLLKLKCRLQEFSIRYNSHVLAAEVLNINSCLPYEQRIPPSGKSG